MDQIIETAFQQGGMALAFVLMLIMYRELWQKRFDELKQYASRLDAHTELLLTTLRETAQVEERLVQTVDQMMQESRARMAEILTTSAAAEKAIREHLPAAAVAAEESKKTTLAAQAAEASAKEAILLLRKGRKTP